MEQEGLDIVRVAPRELAETLYIIHSTASQHFGRSIAQESFDRLNSDTSSRPLPDYDRIYQSMRTIARETVSNLPSLSAACFLAHEAYRAIHQSSIVAHCDPVMYDVHELLLEQAASIADSLSDANEFRSALSQTRVWYQERSQSSPATACETLRKAARCSWPESPFELV